MSRSPHDSIRINASTLHNLLFEVSSQYGGILMELKTIQIETVYTVIYHLAFSVTNQSYDDRRMMGNCLDCDIIFSNQQIYRNFNIVPNVAHKCYAIATSVLLA